VIEIGSQVAAYFIAFMGSKGGYLNCSNVLGNLLQGYMAEDAALNLLSDTRAV